MTERPMTEPSMTEPALTEPAMTEPAMTKPSMTEPPGRFENAGTLEPLPLVPAATPLLRAIGLTKTFATPRGQLELFRDLDLMVRQGEMVAIVGESGSGKSSLLHLLAALDHPTSGEVRYGGQSLSTLTPRQTADFRNREIGYVWQAHYLLPEFTALENVAMPLLTRGDRPARAREQALAWLAEVGLAERAGNRSGELSGGEQQRVSLARALITQPKVLLADEPTGNLDAHTAEAVFALMERLHAAHRLTSILVTHNMHFAARCHRLLHLGNGRLVEQPTAPAELPRMAGVS